MKIILRITKTAYSLEWRESKEQSVFKTFKKDQRGEFLKQLLEMVETAEIQEETS